VHLANAPYKFIVCENRPFHVCATGKKKYICPQSRAKQARITAYIEFYIIKGLLQEGVCILSNTVSMFKRLEVRAIVANTRFPPANGDP